MSDEFSDRTSYSSSGGRRSSSGSDGARAGSGAVKTGGASTGARKADSPSAWLRTPAERTDASARGRAWKGR